MFSDINKSFLESSTMLSYYLKAEMKNKHEETQKPSPSFPTWDPSHPTAEQPFRVTPNRSVTKRRLTRALLLQLSELPVILVNLKAKLSNHCQPLNLQLLMELWILNMNHCRRAEVSRKRGGTRYLLVWRPYAGLSVYWAADPYLRHLHSFSCDGWGCKTLKGWLELGWH